jgi:glycosyltransferase involved in cell wall biosynthesis
MINLVIVSPGFAVDENDSVCLPFLQIYIKVLIKNPNIHLRIISEQYPVKENYEWQDMNVYTLQKRKRTRIDKFWTSFRLKRCLKKLHQASKIDIVHHFWLSKQALVSADFCQQNSIKHIVTLAGQEVLNAKKFINSTILNYSQTFCVSTFHLNKLNENSILKAKVIEWGIEEIKLKDTERKIDLLFCGWINEVKNTNQFIEIVSQLNEKNKITRVAICGGGIGLAKLQQKIEEIGLQNIIELKGEIQRNEVLEYMQQSKILVHTSHFESFGLVLIEALACGCKVVSKPVGIAYQNNKIINCELTNAFVIEIEKLLEDNSVHFHNDYNIQKTVNAYMKVYTH